MYAPKPAKPPMVRPRSSLSAEEHLRKQQNKRKNNSTIVTLVGFCLFLLVLCLFLLGALVYVGRSLVNDKTAGSAKFHEGNDSSDLINNRLQFPISKPIRLRAANNQILKESTQKKRHNFTVSPMASKSKILQHIKHRLPFENIKPKKYDLVLRANNLQQGTFTGNISIHLEIIKPISFIPLHSKFLNVTTEEVQKLNSNGDFVNKIEPSLSFEYKAYEYWITEFDQPLETGNYTIKLAFNGSLINRIVGFYQSSYFNEKTKEKR